MLSDKVKGYIYGTISGASYGLIPLFSLPVMRQGMDSDSLLLYRYGLAATVMGAIMALRGESMAIKWRDVPWVVLLGVLFACSTIFMFISFDYIPTGMASTVFYTYPLFTVLTMTTLFGERLTIGRTLSLLMAVAGVALLYATKDGGNLSLTGVALAVGSAISYALYIVITNRSRVREMPSSRLAFWSMVVGGVVFFIRGDFGQELQAVPSAEAWVLVLLLAIVPTVVSCTALVVAIRCVGSTTTSILGAMEPLTAVLCGTLVFGEPMSLRIFIGIMVIIAAVLLLVASDARREKQKK